MKKAFTILELLVIMVIISVLGTLAVPAYMRSMEMTYDNQAKADLKLISNAEKGYSIDMGSYYVPPNSTNLELNSVLGLALSAGTDRKWNFLVNSAGCAWAARNGGDSRKWHMNITDTEVYNNTCP